MDLFFIIFGLIVPSFRTYDYQISKNREVRQASINWLRFYVVMSIYAAVFAFLNRIFDGLIYQVIRAISLWYLVHNRGYGAVSIYYNFVDKFIDMFPFLVDFADYSHNASFQAKSKKLIGHFVSKFVDSYNTILASIDIQPQ